MWYTCLAPDQIVTACNPVHWFSRPVSCEQPCTALHSVPPVVLPASLTLSLCHRANPAVSRCMHGTSSMQDHARMQRTRMQDHIQIQLKRLGRQITLVPCDPTKHAVVNYCLTCCHLHLSLSSSPATALMITLVHPCPHHAACRASVQGLWSGLQLVH